MASIIDSPTTIIDSHVRIQAAKSESPAAWLWWSGLSLLAATCGRAVCTRLLGSHGPSLFPNLFIGIIGRPNSGKTIAVRATAESLEELRIRRAPDSLPPERLLTWAHSASQKNMDEGKDTGIVLALENMDSLFDRRMSRTLKAFLCAAYDCASSYERETQSRGAEPILRLCLNILMAGTPAHLGACFQGSDWQDGLASRFIFVASEEVRIESLESWPPGLSESLLSDLSTIRAAVARKTVEIPWTSESKRARASWRRAERDRPASHPHAGGYWDRRDTNAAKIAMLLAISEAKSVDTSIGLAAWDAALLSLSEVEASLGFALSLTGANPYAATQERLVQWVHGLGPRDVRESEIRRWLLHFIPPQYVQATVDTTVAAGMLVAVDGDTPKRTFRHPAFQTGERIPWRRLKEAGAAGRD